MEHYWPMKGLNDHSHTFDPTPTNISLDPHDPSFLGTFRSKIILLRWAKTLISKKHPSFNFHVLSSTGSDDFKIKPCDWCEYHKKRTFTPWCQIFYLTVPNISSLLNCYLMLYTFAMGTQQHLAALNKSGSHAAPWGPTPNFLRS